MCAAAELGARRHGRSRAVENCGNESQSRIADERFLRIH